MSMSRVHGAVRGILTLLSALIFAITGCGGSSTLTDELRVVPGLCFLHIHLIEGFDTTILPGSVSSLMPVWLCDSLLTRGPLGVSLIGVNLTDLTPQLLFLTRDLEPSGLAALAASGMGCEVHESGGRLDLTTPGGSLLASAAGREGWSCLVTGSGADGAVDRWLTLEEQASLASDSGLVSIAGGDCDVTVLVSRNTISFLSFIPDGMLSRSERAMLNSVKALIQEIGPEALRIGVGIPAENPLDAYAEMELLRSGGYTSFVRLEVSDTGLSLDSLIVMAASMMGG
jgi:hypothetical protein